MATTVLASAEPAVLGSGPSARRHAVPAWGPDLGAGPLASRWRLPSARPCGVLENTQWLRGAVQQLLKVLAEGTPALFCAARCQQRVNPVDGTRLGRAAW